MNNHSFGHSDAKRFYPGQFATTPDLMFVAIPQQEIVLSMAGLGDHVTLNNVCLSVASVAEAISAAQDAANQIS
ncbi:MAG: hypothetical protein AAF541_18855 [Pseudomonadota bacterium]